MTIRRLRRSLPFLGLVASLAFGCTSRSLPPPVADLPNQQLFGIHEGSVRLSDLTSDRVAVIDLWATWCSACAIEQPKLQRLSDTYPKDQLRVVGVAVGEEQAMVQKYVVQHALRYPIYLDPGFQLSDALGESRIPRILIVEPGSRITYRSDTLDSATLEHVAVAVARVKRDAVDRHSAN
jgi:thiol-disulfide isomerase/thioredoxin